MGSRPSAEITPKQAARKLFADSIAKGFKPVALHEYREKSGHPIYWRVRMKNDDGEKFIRPFHKNGAGFTVGEPKFAGPKPLYGLESLADPTSPVWVVEGEQKVDALRGLGLVAVTSGSATSADTADWSPLRGCNCAYIWPDNDESGAKYAQSVAAILRGQGLSVEIVDVASLGLPEKGDVVDWLEAHRAAGAGDVHALPRRPAQADAWPEVRAFASHFGREAYPVDALPREILAAVEEVRAFVKAPIAMIASSAIGALSVATQAHVDVMRAEKLCGPTSLFLLTLGESGERKTKVDQCFLGAIQEYVRQQDEAAKPILKQHEAAIAAWQAQHDGMVAAIKEAAKKGKPIDRLRTDLEALAQEKPEAPRVPRLLRGDDTPESLAYSLAKTWPSAGVVSSEAGIVFGSHAMGKDSIMRNLALLNTLWDGGDHLVSRRTSESFTVRGARLTMALQIQETVLRSFFDRTGGLSRGSGFLARFLLSWPESTQGTRLYSEPPAGWPALAAFNRRITAILNDPAPVDEAGALSPVMLTLASDTKAAWIEFHDQIEVELGTGGELQDVRDIAAKIAENAVRLAALFQVFEHGVGPIQLGCFEGASRIVAWHLHEARRFFGEIAIPPEMAHAARIEAWLIDYCRKHGDTIVSTQDVLQRGPQPRKSDALDAAVIELEQLGRARGFKDGRRKLIELNPLLLESGR
jgi:hypothetical protein